MTIGKSVRILGLICGLLLLAAPVQAGDMPDLEITESFSREAPLTQNDIDAYLAAFPYVNEPTTAAQNEVVMVYEKAGISPERGIYVVVKIAHASAVIQFEKELGAGAAESYRDSLDDAFKPSPEEVELVRKNTPKLEAAMEATAAW